MKLKQLAFLMLLSSQLILASNFHNQLIIPSVDSDYPNWKFAGQTIFEKEYASFHKLITKWNNKIDALCKELNYKIREDIGTGIEQLDYYMKQEKFVEVYTNFYKKALPDVMNDEIEIDPFVLNFIQMKLSFCQSNKSIKVFAQDNLAMPAFSFGTNQDQYYLLAHSDIYSPGLIQSIYKSAQEETYQYHIASHVNHHESRIIEYCNLLHFGIAQALSGIMHQGDYFSKLLIYFTYNSKSTSQKTQIYATNFIQFRSFMEACLQSKNPYEVAVFVEPQLDDLNQEFILLWREFIEDIKNSYDPEDLQEYQEMALDERRAHLFALNNTNEDSDINDDEDEY